MDILSELKESLLERLKIIATILMDAVFMVAWVAITWGTAKFINHLELKDLDLRILQIFQWSFGISTLITVMLFVIKDVLTLLIKTRLDLHNLRKNG